MWDSRVLKYEDSLYKTYLLNFELLLVLLLSFVLPVSFILCVFFLPETFVITVFKHKCINTFYD